MSQSQHLAAWSKCRIVVEGRITSPLPEELTLTRKSEDNWGQPAAAKSLQSCPTLCDPMDSSPPGSPAPGILQARTPAWVAISFSRGQPRKGLMGGRLLWGRSEYKQRSRSERENDMFMEKQIFQNGWQGKV